MNLDQEKRSFYLEFPNVISPGVLLRERHGEELLASIRGEQRLTG